MIIADTRSFMAGRYRVQQRPRNDNPAWPVYIIFLGEKFIGKQFSVPSESDCEWLQRQQEAAAIMYSENTRWREFSSGRRKCGRPRKADAQRELEEAMES